MINKTIHYIGIAACIALIAACFLPWTYYLSVDETFTGFNVKPFPNGTYYGKAGAVLSVMTALVLLLKLLQKTWANRVNLFLSAVIVAYAIRTYIIFTGSLFEGEVKIYAGLYAVVALSFVILVTCVFPKENLRPRN